MSTSYYALRAPVTSLEVYPGRGTATARLYVSVNHNSAGVLTVFKDELQDLVSLFAARQPALQTHWGGDQRGVVVTELTAHLPGEQIVISDCGDIFSVAHVRSCAKTNEGSAK